MTTAYSLSDTAPKDAGGQKFIALPNITTSQNDFSLLLGLGASTIGATSKIHGYLGIATHISASPITNAPAGVMKLVAYTLNPSSIATNNAIHQRGSDRGEAYITGLSGVTCAMAATSRETVTLASGILYNVLVAGMAMTPTPGSLVVMNGTTSLANFIFGSPNETLPILNFGIHGACFGSLILERRNATGTPFVTMNYTIWGQ